MRRRRIESVEDVRALCKELGIRFRLRRFLSFYAYNTVYVATGKKVGLCFNTPPHVLEYLCEPPPDIKLRPEQKVRRKWFVEKLQKEAATLIDRPFVARPELNLCGVQRTELYVLTGTGSVDFGLTKRGGLGTFMGIIHQHPFNQEKPA